MFKVNNEKLAQSIAKDKGLHYGQSVFDGKFYVGTIDQLQKIGVAVKS